MEFIKSCVFWRKDLLLQASYNLPHMKSPWETESTQQWVMLDMGKYMLEAEDKNGQWNVPRNHKWNVKLNYNKWNTNVYLHLQGHRWNQCGPWQLHSATACTPCPPLSSPSHGHQANERNVYHSSHYNKFKVSGKLQVTFPLLANKQPNLMVKEAAQVEANDSPVVLIQPQGRYLVHLPPLKNSGLV